MKKVAFVGGKIFDSDNECFVDANVLCFGDTIERITNEAVDKDEYEIIDLDGKYLAQKVMELKNDRIKLYNISKNAGKDAKINALSEICRIITDL